MSGMSQSTHRLFESERANLARYVVRHGLRRTYTRLGMSRHSVTALMAGAGVRAGTVALFRSRVDRIAHAEAA